MTYLYNTTAEKKQIQIQTKFKLQIRHAFPLDGAASYWGLSLFYKDLYQEYSCGRWAIHFFKKKETHICIVCHIFQTTFTYIIQFYKAPFYDFYRNLYYLAQQGLIVSKLLDVSSIYFGIWI